MTTTWAEPEVEAPADEADAQPCHIYELRWHEVGPTLPRRVASCGGDALAATLATLHDEGQLTDDSKVGILWRPDPDAPGTWVVNPWAKGRRR